MNPVDRNLTRELALRAAAFLVIVVIAYGAYRWRKNFIRSFFVEGEGGAPAPALALPSDPELATRGLDPATRVRVVIVDGVSAADAAALPNYSRVCAEGSELVLDIGFPSVSLPVQRVLWTGLTQQQTGVLFFNKVIDAPPVGIPGQVAGSVAVAESHAKIVHSMGFARVAPALDDVPEDWSLNATWRAWADPHHAGGFARAAMAAVASDARLVLVHILRTDTICHKRGRHSSDYRAAITWGDELVGALYEAERAAHASGTRWFVLADHGHRDGGGHGGAEPGIRNTRLCVAGGVDRDAVAGNYLHLVDLARAIADSVGVDLDPASAGRPFYAALAAPVDRDATLPRPSLARWLLAGALVLGALLLSLAVARWRWWALPWWLPIAYLAVISIELVPSLSTSMIYKADGRVMYTAALPGLALLALSAPLCMRRLGVPRAALSQLLAPLAVTLAALILCNFDGGDPPLMPVWTAHASLFVVLLCTGALVVGLAQLLRPRSGPARL